MRIGKMQWRRLGLAALVVVAWGSATAVWAQEVKAPASQSDFTGYWVALMTEDWRWRMLPPAKGDYASIPLNLNGKKTADTWDPAKDEANGEQCRSYGAPRRAHAPKHVTTSARLDLCYRATVRHAGPSSSQTLGSNPTSTSAVSTCNCLD